MNKGLILAAALLTASSFSVQAQQCSDEATIIHFIVELNRLAGTANM